MSDQQIGTVTNATGGNGQDRMPKTKFDYQKVKKATEMLLEGIGDDINREGIKETPDRVARMYQQIFNGYDLDPKDYIKLFDNEGKDMVTLSGVPFYSYCEHHLQPFIGTLTISYIPNGKVIGISKLVRIARVYAKRPQIQERLTSQIHKAIEDNIPNLGVAVNITAEHMCMTIRGVRTPGALTTTTKLSGRFEEPRTQAEFLGKVK